MRDDLEQLLATVRRFVDAHVLPLERRFLLEGFAAVATDLEGARNTARELGIFAPHLPLEDGGLALPLTAVGEVSRVLGRTPLGETCRATPAIVGERMVFRTAGRLLALDAENPPAATSSGAAR